MTLRKILTALTVVALVLPAGASLAAEANDTRGSAALEVQGTGGGATIDLDASVSGDAATGTEAEDTSDTNETNAGTDGSLRVNALGIPVLTSAQVTTDADLELFRENMRLEDKNVAAVNLDSEEEVTVEYWHKGHLLGLFPVSIKSTTSVMEGSDGRATVQTRMPWWNLFVTGTGRIGSSVDSSLGGSTTLQGDFGLSADAAARARVLEAIARAHAQASTKTSAAVIQ